MFDGQLLAIAIADAAKQPMRLEEEVEAVPELGLRGDRYHAGRGALQWRFRKPEQQVSLIAEEALAAANDQLLFPIEHLDTRRNLLTREVPLNDLVNQKFWIGDVLLRGMQLCAPCAYLERLTAKGIQHALRGRGGLRAQILQGGTLHVGDRIRPFHARTVKV